MLPLTLSQTVDSGTLPPTSQKVTPPTRRSLSVHTPIRPTLYPSITFSYFECINRAFLQTDPCGLQVFHLLSHTDGSGGASLLVDGFYAASILKELHPDAYALLSMVHVNGHAAGEPSAIYTPYPASGFPVLGHDKVTGELFQVRWNNDDRSVMRGLRPELVEEWLVIFLLLFMVPGS